jgi:hypothetical protein
MSVSQSHCSLCYSLALFAGAPVLPRLRLHTTHPEGYPSGVSEGENELPQNGLHSFR